MPDDHFAAEQPVLRTSPPTSGARRSGRPRLEQDIARLKATISQAAGIADVAATRSDPLAKLLVDWFMQTAYAQSLGRQVRTLASNPEEQDMVLEAGIRNAFASLSAYERDRLLRMLLEQVQWDRACEMLRDRYAHARTRPGETAPAQRVHPTTNADDRHDSRATSTANQAEDMDRPR